ncbi:excinuclease ABC subunit UvrA [Cyanobacterium sp. uoEpiScrs1]|uniref:excinuclease ABC subunit UvrA n=1 Tax=Cyanobacterium sp. uoEpiScrs1 TaxID=2976343 RepID=UPI00226A33B0|nr:excinuclease ABC subunit UvrA [Cyanobacterium sp. uoEpiScrs1]
MSDSNNIRIRGARQHNLKNIDLDLPREHLIVFTGVSGSGKSSLAFDTIFAEGQRRYVESLSAYARQFLGQLDKPDVDAIEGLSPAISIDQKSTSHNPRSTVGTVTEIYDYLRLLFGRAGEPHCPVCDRSITPQTVDQMCDSVMALKDRTKFQLLSPVIRRKKGTHQKLLSNLASQGFVRVRIDGEVRELSDTFKLNKNNYHNIEIIIDRLIKKEGIEERLTDSLSTCLHQSNGLAIVDILDSDNDDNQDNKNISEIMFSENFACPEHGAVIEELSPRLFSFNSPYGACPNCHGLGSLRQFSPDLVIPDPSLPLYSAIAPWSDKNNSYYLSFLYSIGQAYGFDIQTPWNKLTKYQQEILLHGTKEPILIEKNHRTNKSQDYYRTFSGILTILERNYKESNSDIVKQKLEKYLIDRTCEVCKGRRLKPESLSVRLGQYTINELTSVSIDQCLEKINNLKLTQRQQLIGQLALKEIKNRLQFLLDVGLDYLTLDRGTKTLSGGEAQRIRLATQIGSGLTGVLYVLDEPSIGLHQRDNGRLLKTLKKLRDLGNTLIVVEHDEDTIRSADHIVDIGPLAGINGGYVVCQGTLETLIQADESLTADYISGRKVIKTPARRRPGNGAHLKLISCQENNLKNIDIDIPLGKLVCITGVSGSGKSTLVNELLYPALQHHLNHYVPFPKKLGKIKGLESIDKVIVIDQSPIGRTPRSNPATYTGIFDSIRALFSETIEAKARGYKQGQFSFNVKGGRCETCSGQGVNIIEMNFLPDVYVKCEVCKGSRYNRETLQVKYKDYSIADVLNMTIEEALDVFQNIPKVKKRLQTLVDVGLGYIKLGQSAPTLSGGEAQRIKLASELSKRATGKTIYLIDEPTTGLSFYDVHHLLNVLQRLVDKGHSMLVIEHNLDVIRCADWVIDLGPEGGNKGGKIIAVGTPEQVASNPNSYTGKYLKQTLKNYPG